MTLAQKLECLAKAHTNISVSEETDILWMEIETLFMELYFSSDITRMKVWVYGNWEEGNILYRIDGDEKTVRRPFKRVYSPNRLSNIAQIATQNGLGVKFSSPDDSYKDPLLEIWHPKDDKEFRLN